MEQKPLTEKLCALSDHEIHTRLSCSAPLELRTSTHILAGKTGCKSSDRQTTADCCMAGDKKDPSLVINGDGTYECRWSKDKGTGDWD
ncbi:MAG: hypothetical protein R3E79_56415 [Caldilineaceae bacterium]